MPAETAPKETRTAYHHGNLRGQLLEAIRGLIEEKGPDGFTVAEAARAAGVSSGAPYRHFADRDAIMRAVTLSAMERLTARMVEGASQGEPGSLERISGMGQGYIDFARAEPGVFRMVFGLTEAHEDDAEIEASARACFGVVLEAVAARLGLAPDDPAVQARSYMLWSFVHGHAFLTIDRKSKMGELDIDEAAYLDHVGRGIVDAAR